MKGIQQDIGKQVQRYLRLELSKKFKKEQIKH